MGNTSLRAAKAQHKYQPLPPYEPEACPPKYSDAGQLELTSALAVGRAAVRDAAKQQSAFPLWAETKGRAALHALVLAGAVPQDSVTGDAIADVGALQLAVQKLDCDATPVTPSLRDRIESVYRVYTDKGDAGDLESVDLVRLGSRMRSLLNMPDSGGRDENNTYNDNTLMELGRQALELENPERHKIVRTSSGALRCVNE